MWDAVTKSSFYVNLIRTFTVRRHMQIIRNEVSSLKVRKGTVRVKRKFLFSCFGLLPSFPRSPICSCCPFFSRVRVWDRARRCRLLPFRRHVLHERLPHDVVDPLGARQLHLQPCNLVLEFGHASVSVCRSCRGKRVVVVAAAIPCRSRPHEKFPVAKKLLTRVGRDRLVRDDLSVR
jgi:hypothetical protein